MPPAAPENTIAATESLPPSVRAAVSAAVAKLGPQRSGAANASPKALGPLRRQSRQRRQFATSCRQVLLMAALSRIAGRVRLEDDDQSADGYR